MLFKPMSLDVLGYVDLTIIVHVIHNNRPFSYWSGILVFYWEAFKINAVKFKSQLKYIKRLRHHREIGDLPILYTFKDD